MRILPLFHALPLVLALSYGRPQNACAGTCADQLAPKIRGQSIDDKLRFLEEGEPQICPRTLNPAECVTSHRWMVTSLHEYKAEIERVCRDLEAGKTIARQGPARSQTHFTVQSRQLAGQSASLEGLRTMHESSADKLKIIRISAAQTVRAQLKGQPGGAGSANPNFFNLAVKALQSTVSGKGTPENLREEILAMGGNGNDQAMNTLWAAANALELEQHHTREQEKLAATLRGLADVKGDTDNRDASMRGKTGNNSNPLSDLLSSPALPAALMAAAQLAAAQKKGEEAPLVPQTTTGASAPPPVSATPETKVSPLLTEGKREPSSAPAQEQTGDKKTEETKGSGTPAFPSSPFLDTYGRSSLTSEKSEGRAAARPASLSGSSLGGGGSESESKPETEGRNPGGPDTAKETFTSGGGGGGGGGYGGSGYSSGGKEGGPAEPEKDMSGLEKILAEEGASPEEVLGLDSAEDTAGQDEGSLFRIVHAAYVRQLKRGSFDLAPRALEPRIEERED